tara:strand:+ start:664 stop:963 length:300 start_codon:yes stop_codon:yes gene_type:complete
LLYSFSLEQPVLVLKIVSADKAFFYASGRSSNEAGFLLQLFARLFGTNNINNCSFFCHQASGVGLNQSLGTSKATGFWENRAFAMETFKQNEKHQGTHW